MREVFRQLPIQLGLAILLSAPVNAQDSTNPEMERFQQDLKAAVLNGSITGPQVKQLQADAETLKKARSEQTPEAQSICSHPGVPSQT